MKKEKEWIVYMIKTSNGLLYTGITNDLERRFSNHKTKKNGAKFFHISEAKEIVFKEAHANRSKASIREAEIKKLKREEKIKLIEKKLVDNKTLKITSEN